MTAEINRTDKLADAVGMLDDRTVARAKYSSVYTRRFVTGIVAAVLAVLMIPIGTLFFLATRPAGAPAPNGSGTRLIAAEDCAFNQSELNAFVSQTVHLSPDATMPGGFYEQGYGSTLPEIAFAGLNRVVFRYGSGVFVYDTAARAVTATYDLDKLGLPGFRQGSVSAWIFVDDLGLYAYVGSYDDGVMSDTVYRLELDLGRAEQLSLADIKSRSPELLQNPSCLRALTDGEWQELTRRGIEGHGELVAVLGAKRTNERHLMALDGAVQIKDTKLVILRDDGSVEKISIFE